MDEEKELAGPIRRASAAYDWVEAAVFALVCVALVFTFLFRIVGVDGESMQNTLMDRDRLLVVSNFYTPQRGDIVVIKRQEEEPLVKRIIAVGGDTIDIDPETMLVSVNGEVLDEPYIDCPTPPMEFPGAMTVEEGYVFVMGDNRLNSHDSRYMDIGLVKEEDIMGKAVFRIWPLNSIGGLY